MFMLQTVLSSDVVRVGIRQVSVDIGAGSRSHCSIIRYYSSRHRCWWRCCCYRDAETVAPLKRTLKGRITRLLGLLVYAETRALLFDTKTLISQTVEWRFANSI